MFNKIRNIIFGSVAAPTEPQITLFTQVIGVSCCDKCFATFNGKAWNSFVLHLIDKHQIPDAQAYQIVDDLAKRLRNKFSV